MMRALGLVWQESVKTVDELADLEPIAYEARFVEDREVVYVCSLNGVWMPLSMDRSTEQVDDECVNANEYELINLTEWRG